MKEIAVAQFETKEFNLFKEAGEIVMSFEQLSEMLGYKELKYLRDLVENNPELNDKEFSILKKTKDTKSGKERELRFFTEDGIYEVCFLSRMPKARLFKKHVRELLKRIRNGELETIKPMALVEWQKIADKMIAQMTERNVDLEEMGKNLDIIINLIPTFEEKIQQIDQMRKDISTLKVGMTTLEMKMNDLYKVLAGEESIEDAE